MSRYTYIFTGGKLRRKRREPLPEGRNAPRWRFPVPCTSDKHKPSSSYSIDCRHSKQINGRYSSIRFSEAIMDDNTNMAAEE